MSAVAIRFDEIVDPIVGSVQLGEYMANTVAMGEIVALAERSGVGVVAGDCARCIGGHHQLGRMGQRTHDWFVGL